MADTINPRLSDTSQPQAQPAPKKEVVKLGFAQENVMAIITVLVIVIIGLIVVIVWLWNKEPPSSRPPPPTTKAAQPERRKDPTAGMTTAELAKLAGPVSVPDDITPDWKSLTSIATNGTRTQFNDAGTLTSAGYVVADAMAAATNHTVYKELNWEFS